MMAQLSSSNQTLILSAAPFRVDVAELCVMAEPCRSVGAGAERSDWVR